MKRKLNLRRALTVQGWMSDREMAWLAEHAADCKRIAEVGSWMGRSTRAMADNTSGTIFAVDTWHGSAETAERLAGKPDDWLFQKFFENLKDHISPGPSKVIPIQKESLDAAAMFKSMGVCFDMIFIDAAHDYEHVKEDVLAWRELLAPGGILCGHDWGSAGVKQALDEVAPLARRASYPGSIWQDNIARPSPCAS